MERLREKMGDGLASIMCPGVACRASSPEWVDAVLGVLGLTSAACVRALVYYSSVEDQAEAVYTRLKLDPDEHKRFEDVVCKGRKPTKRKRVLEWLGAN